MGKLASLLVLFVTFAADTAFADSSPQISAASPTNGLPAISSDGKSFVRPVHVQPRGCSGIQIFAEIGTVGGPSTDTKSELLVVKDECGKGGSQAEKNIEKVNKTLAEKSYKSVGTVQTLSLPASIELPGGTFKVDATGGLTCAVGVEGSSTDRWSVTLDGEITEVRGWYTGKNASGAGYVAIEVSTDCDDTGKKGRERWIDFWPAGAAATSDGSAPVDVAASWLAALKKNDAKALASASSTPFWKAGFSPVSGKQAKKCKKLQKAKNEKQLKGVAACMALAGNLYTRFAGDQNYLAEIDMSEFPVELKKHKKKIAKLVKQGHKLVRYFLNEQGFYINLVFVLDPDTDFQTVVVALESVEIEDEMPEDGI